MTSVRLPDGGRLAVTVRGAGPVLLLLRPLGGSLASWEPFSSMLAERARVVMFDPRGVGCSSAAPWGATTRGMAADAVAVLDALAIPRAHVYGLSLGGMVATWLALDAPARVERLLLASTPTAGSDLHPRVLAHGWDLARCLARPPRAASACLAARVLSPAFRGAHPDEVARIRARARERPASHRGLLTLLRAATRHNSSEHVHRMAADTLVVAGGRDTILRPDAQRALAERLQHGRFALVADAGHDVSAEAPVEAARLVLVHVCSA